MKINRSTYNIIIISTLLSFRMLGLFMLLPVFSIFSHEYSNSSLILIGVALGSYGFSQSIFIIPFGFLSDKYDRLSIIKIGLLIFALGSLIGYISSSIYGIILARCLQGSAAISAVLLALVSDISDHKDITRNMAFVGISIGASFLIAIILGPIISYSIGIDKIFLFSFFSSILSLYISNRYLKVNKINVKKIFIKKKFNSFFNKNLLILYSSIFTIHANLTAIFLVIPHLLIQTSDFFFQSIKFYLPILIIALFFSYPILIFLEKRIKNMSIIFTAMGMFLISNFIILLFHDYYFQIFLGLAIFFISFNLLETFLPSLISKTCYSELKGTTLGIFSCFQFIGIFFGGIVGGVINHMFGFHVVIYFCILMIFTWFLLNILYGKINE